MKATILILLFSILTAPVFAEEYTPVAPLENIAPPAAEPIPDSKVETDKITPFDGKGVERVLAIDLSAQKHEGEALYPRTLLRVGLGFDRVSPGYPLLKDDDTFVNNDTRNLPGASIEVVPRWKLDFLTRGKMNVFVSTPLTGGYFEGRLPIQRIGIQPNVHQFKYQLFPFSLAAQIGAEFWNRVGLHLSYGVAAEILHQAGDGLLDSVSDLFYGEAVSVVIEGNISNTFQLFLRYELKGDRILFKATTFSDQLIVAGVSIALTT